MLVRDLLKWAVPISLLIGWVDVVQKNVVARPRPSPSTLIDLSTKVAITSSSLSLFIHCLSSMFL